MLDENALGLIEVGRNITYAPPQSLRTTDHSRAAPGIGIHSCGAQIGCACRPGGGHRGVFAVHCGSSEAGPLRLDRKGESSDPGLCEEKVEGKYFRMNGDITIENG